MRHPAEYYVRYLIIRSPHMTDAQILKSIQDLGFLSPDETFFGFLRQSLAATPPPVGFDPANRMDRPSMQYLRDQKVYEFFYPTSAVQEAWDNLPNIDRRQVVEQIIMGRLDFRVAARKVNEKYNWHLTEEGLSIHRHYFWNINLLTFDEWGRYLYDRSQMYDQYMHVLRAPKELSYYFLRLDQLIESTDMVREAQQIAHFTLQEVKLVPGVRADKVKAISVLTKAITDCHTAMSTSDMAIAQVLKDFEKFRMHHPEQPAPDIKTLAPAGNFSNSGLAKDKDKVN